MGKKKLEEIYGATSVNRTREALLHCRNAVGENSAEEWLRNSLGMIWTAWAL